MDRARLSPGVVEMVISGQVPTQLVYCLCLAKANRNLIFFFGILRKKMCAFCLLKIKVLGSILYKLVLNLPPLVRSHRGLHSAFSMLGQLRQLLALLGSLITSHLYVSACDFECSFLVLGKRILVFLSKH